LSDMFMLDTRLQPLIRAVLVLHCKNIYKSIAVVVLCFMANIASKCSIEFILL